MKDTTKEEAMPSEKQSILTFLLGEDHYQGYWFGDAPREKRAPFWWRPILRQEVEALKQSNKEMLSALSRISNCNDLETAQEYAREAIKNAEQ